jgi:hypothetical protein
LGDVGRLLASAAALLGGVGRLLVSAARCYFLWFKKAVSRLWKCCLFVVLLLRESLLPLDICEKAAGVLANMAMHVMPLWVLLCGSTALQEANLMLLMQMGEDQTGWRCPVPDDPVDPDILKDHATIIKRCHACHIECIRNSATGEVTISGTKFHGATPGTRESVVGFFVCQTCPPHTKRGRGGVPMPYRRLWCVKCLKFGFGKDGAFGGAFRAAFSDKPDGSWAQNPIKCWHCSTSGTDPKMRDCLNSCPKTLYNNVKAQKPQKPKRKPETALRTRPDKRPCLATSPLLAPPMSAVDDHARRAENYQQLAATIKERGLFTSKALPGDFLFFLPDFKLKDNEFQLVEPSLEKRQFPKAVILGCATTTNGHGILRCPSCSEPSCPHVCVLQRLVDATKLKAPVSEKRLPSKEKAKKESKEGKAKEQQQSEPEGEQDPFRQPLSTLGFKAAGDYWAVQLKGEKWVLCGKKADDTWVCQLCRGEEKCRHICKAAKLTYTPPVVKKR